VRESWTKHVYGDHRGGPWGPSDRDHRQFRGQCSRAPARKPPWDATRNARRGARPEVRDRRSTAGPIRKGRPPNGPLKSVADRPRQRPGRHHQACPDVQVWGRFLRPADRASGIESGRSCREQRPTGRRIWQREIESGSCGPERRPRCGAGQAGCEPTGEGFREVASESAADCAAGYLTSRTGPSGLGGRTVEQDRLGFPPCPQRSARRTTAFSASVTATVLWAAPATGPPLAAMSVLRTFHSMGAVHSS
jgi:hypothetical protein